MRTLVTGAAGFIGSHLVERLLARGDQVVGVDNFDPFYSPVEKRTNLAMACASERFQLVEADVCDGEAILAAVDHDPPDAIVHLAAKAGVRPSIADPSGYVRANVVATQAVLDLARRLTVRRVVFGSSSSVYGNAAKVPFAEDESAVEPISPYAATKRAAELLCAVHHQLYGGSMLCLRFFTVYGPRQRPDLAIRKFCTLMAQGRPIQMFGDGTMARDYTWIEDILVGVLAATDRGAVVPDEYQVINLGGSRTTDLRRLVGLLAEALGVTPVVEHLPPQPGDVVCTWADVSKARRLLDYRPGTSIQEGIPRFVDWFRDHLLPHSGRPAARAAQLASQT